MVIWLVGLSGAGKTTIGREMYKLWKPLAPNTVMVDGDEVRRIFQQDKQPSDFSLESRRRNALRIVEICSWLDKQQINVICCILCLFDDVMLANHDKFSKYYQVYIDASIDVLKHRDPKGIYERAGRGDEKNVVGLDMEFHPPSMSDIIISTDQGAPGPKILASKILSDAGVKLRTKI